MASNDSSGNGTEPQKTGFLFKQGNQDNYCSLWLLYGYNNYSLPAAGETFIYASNPVCDIIFMLALLFSYS